MTEPEGLDGHQPAIPSPLNFTSLVASAARLYQRHGRRLMALFAAIGVLISLLPALFFFELPEGAVIPVYLFVQVAIPAVMVSLGIAVSAVVMHGNEDGGSATVTGAIASVRSHLRQSLAAALLAGMLSIFIAVFLGILSFILIYLFFGPPILIQVVTLEKARLQSAWPRMKALMKGHWVQVIMYLFVIGLGIALMQSLTLAVVTTAVQDVERWARTVIVNIANLAVIALAMPFLAATGYALYKDLVHRSEEPV